MLAVVLIILGLFSRLIPHWPNFTALGAVAIFGGSAIKPRALSALITLTILLITDMLLGFYTGMWVTYLSFLFIAIIGSQLKTTSWQKIGLMGIGGSLFFYFTTNFGVWLSSGLYEQNIFGLAACYLAGLPFLLNFMLGTWFYSLVLFGFFKLLHSKLALA